VSYSAADARQQLLDTLAQAIEGLGQALAALTEAYEMLDENAADRLERGLFRPVQRAYGRAKRTHAEFAERQGLLRREFPQAVPGAPSQGVRGFVESAAQRASSADAAIATLQDSMLPVEVGDPELRAGLADVRALLDGVGPAAQELLRTLGR
jgi:hypothetical protein